ncbi:MAG: formylglycine-generating enzyme family protein, partial [Planctomycetes bacterium]|nr:formylglycine-generating enzyme family protein [Planctomycetota bacterium]
KLADALSKARGALSRRDQGAALAAVAEVLRLEPGNAEAARLKKITMRVPAGFRAAPGTAAEPYTNTGWAKEVIHEKTGIEMVFIPAGEFMMGSPSGESRRDSDEGPVHKVVLTKAFYLGKYEVTNGQYQAFLNSAGYDGSRDADSDYLRHHRDWNKYASTGDSYPIVCVSWKNAQAYCKWAGLRLPTEAEWEYACRAGSSTRFSFGDSDSQLDSYAWYNGNSGSKTHPVGQKRPNGWDLYDMHGNVWECCADWKGDYPSGSVTDPQGPSSESARVLRGGSWNINPQNCRSAYRSYYSPDYSGSVSGVRVARTIN